MHCLCISKVLIKFFRASSNHSQLKITNKSKN